MRFLCRCGNMLTNQLDPNDTEYYVYSDREWSEFEKKGWIYFLDVPYPQYDVWRCEKCDRIYLFKENKVVKVGIVICKNYFDGFIDKRWKYVVL